MREVAPVRGLHIAAMGAAIAFTLCANKAPCAGGVVDPRADWHHFVTDADRDRLRLWHDTWSSAMTKAKGAGAGPAIDAQGELFDPDKALANGATPPPGDYHCRVFKLGANGPAAHDFTTLPAQDCRIQSDGTVSRLDYLTGVQRPAGQIYTDTPGRSVFLGTMVLSDETSAMAYGRDTSRDMAGFVERIGPKRWRLTLPSPRFESLLDVVELTPAK